MVVSKKPDHFSRNSAGIPLKFLDIYVEFDVAFHVYMEWSGFFNI